MVMPKGYPIATHQRCRILVTPTSHQIPPIRDVAFWSCPPKKEYFRGMRPPVARALADLTAAASDTIFPDSPILSRSRLTQPASHHTQKARTAQMKSVWGNIDIQRCTGVQRGSFCSLLSPLSSPLFSIFGCYEVPTR